MNSHCHLFIVTGPTAQLNLPRKKFKNLHEIISKHTAFGRHEGEKCHAYEEHIHKVECGSFISLTFSSSGGMGTAATKMYKRLAHLLSAN